jgi:hypothetical protein
VLEVGDFGGIDCRLIGRPEAFRFPFRYRLLSLTPLVTGMT